MTFQELGYVLLGLRGGPRVYVQEEAVGAMGFYFHRQYRRAFDRFDWRALMPAGVEVRFRHTSHARLRELCGADRVLYYCGRVDV